MTTVAVKERPILFSAPMIRAILDGRKSQTRRICKDACARGVWADAAHPARDGMPIFWWNITGGAIRGRAEITQQTYETGLPCPYGGVGTRLWVREKMREDAEGVWRYAADNEAVGCDRANEAAMVVWAHHNERTYCPSIHMPRWASRITLQITGVRVERLKSISLEDMRAEGLRPNNETSLLWRETLAENFRTLWDQINPKHPWSSDPWTWVIEFKRVEQ
jgi:hypothetical protein